MGRSLTSSNGVLAMYPVGLLTIPQQITGFTAEDIFDSENIVNSELVVGLHNKVVSGWLPNVVKQKVTLMANSSSNLLFEAWYATEQAKRKKLKAIGVWTPFNLGMIYLLYNGTLTSYSAMAGAKRLMQPRSYEITWQDVIALPTIIGNF